MYPSSVSACWRRRQLLLVLSLLLISHPLRAASPADSLRAAGAQPSLADVLDAQGHIRPGTEGSFSAAGFSMGYDATGAPIFAPTQSVGAWDPRFSQPGLSNTVNAIAVSGTDVYIGGSFINMAAIPEADYIVRWDGSTWNALGTGLSNIVYALAVSGTDVYVGGNFIDAGGVAEADRIARWDGNTWNALGTGLDNTVWAIAVSGTDVYVGGQFTSAGSIANTVRIARWDGNAWNALGTGLNNSVYDITVNGSSVYVGGQFTDADGVAEADRIARWDGNAWNALGAGLSNTAYVVTLDPANQFVYAGGIFTQTGDGAVGTNRFGIYTDATLPVELVAFDALTTGGAVTLRWQTAGETNNAGFEVEHLREGRFQPVAFVPGHGTTTEGQRYEYPVGLIAPGVHRFRLRQVDYDGGFTYSAELEVAVSPQEDVLLTGAFPNPFTRQTTLLLHVQRTQHVRAEVFDLTGRRVALLFDGVVGASQPQPLRLEVGNLPSGLYTVRVAGETFERQQQVMLVR